MLQHIRDRSQSWISKVIVALIVLTFALFGLQTLDFNANNSTAATVNGHEITAREVYFEINLQRQQLARSMGENFDPSLLKDEVLQESALQSLVEKKLLLVNALEQSLSVSNSTLDQIITRAPEFQVDGRFNPEVYKQRLSSRGMTPRQFKDYLQQDLVISQLRSGFAGSAFVTGYEARNIARLQNQRRQVRYLILSAAEREGEITVSEEALRSHYEANSDAYLTEEQVRIEYLLLDKLQLQADIQVPEQELRNRYDDWVREKRQAADQQRGAAHILIEFKDDATEAEALKQARTLKNRISAGEDFAELAREYSQDSFSADKGGELGDIEEGFLGEAFDSALAQLDPGEVSEPVRSDFGYQLIRRLETAPVELPSFEEQRETLLQVAQQERAELLFVERVEQLADISFESADLEEPAEAVGLPIQRSEFFTRQNAQSLMSDPRVLQAAFSEALQDGTANSDLIELDNNRAMVLRLLEVKKPQLQPFEAVAESIQGELIRQQVQEQLDTRAGEILAALKRRDKTAEEIGAEIGIGWVSETLQRNEGTLERSLVNAVFRMPRPEDDRQSHGVVTLSTGDKVVVSLLEVLDDNIQGDQEGELSADASLAQLRDALVSTQARSDFTGVLHSLKSHAEIDYP
jgi:peptidyl-prolyl cis-trans isomerase D